MPLDPFLIVQPSLNDSLLVKQGLVEKTAQPPPAHNPHDIQVGFTPSSLCDFMIEPAIGATASGLPEEQHVVADEIVQ